MFIVIRIMQYNKITHNEKHLIVNKKSAGILPEILKRRITGAV